MEGIINCFPAARVQASSHLPCPSGRGGQAYSNEEALLTRAGGSLCQHLTSVPAAPHKPQWSRSLWGSNFRALLWLAWNRSGPHTLNSGPNKAPLVQFFFNLYFVLVRVHTGQRTTLRVSEVLSLLPPWVPRIDLSQAFSDAACSLAWGQVF